MKLYFAGLMNKHVKYDFKKIYKLESYIYIKNMLLDVMQYKDFILDSGIFSYLNGKETKNIDWDRYVFEYAGYIKKNNIKQYIEVDIDSFTALSEVEKLRKNLENLVGWSSMPVWHKSRGMDKWYEICTEYKYICLGGFNNSEISSKQYPYISKMLLFAKNKNCKVHGLGFCRMEWLPLLKFDSVDSTTWKIGVKLGYIYKFVNGKIYRSANKTTYKIDWVKALKSDFEEWVKFSEYAELFL